MRFSAAQQKLSLNLKIHSGIMRKRDAQERIPTVYSVMDTRLFESIVCSAQENVYYLFYDS